MIDEEIKKKIEEKKEELIKKACQNAINYFADKNKWTYRTKTSKKPFSFKIYTSGWKGGSRGKIKTKKFGDLIKKVSNGFFNYVYDPIKAYYEHGLNSEEFITSCINSGLSIIKDHYLKKFTKFLGRFKKPIEKYIDKGIEGISEFLGKKIYSRINNLSDDDDNLPFIYGNNNNFPKGGGNNNGKGPNGKGPNGTSGGGKTGGIEFQIPQEIKGFKHLLYFENLMNQQIIFNINNSNTNEILEVANRFIDIKCNSKKFSSINQVFQTILSEIYGGYLGDGILPYVSLNFNNNGLLYSIMPKYYKKTLIGNILGYLDYFLKGFVNGGFFKEDFVNKWYLTKNTDPNYLNSNFINLKKYIYNNKAKIDNHELYMTVYDLGENISENSKEFYKNSLSAFRIIGIINDNIIIKDNLIIPNCSFRTESDLNIFAGNSNSNINIENTIEALNKMKLIIKALMPNIPYFRGYFYILDMITFAIHYIPTLDANAIYPDFSDSMLMQSGFSSYVSLLPPVFPPLPIKKQIIIEVNLKFSYCINNWLDINERNILNSFLTEYILKEKNINFQEVIENILNILEKKYKDYIFNLIPDKDELKIRNRKELHIDEFINKIQENLRTLSEYPNIIYPQIFEELKSSLTNRIKEIKQYNITYTIETQNIDIYDNNEDKKKKFIL